jgi:hypothetical protein
LKENFSSKFFSSLPSLEEERSKTSGVNLRTKYEEAFIVEKVIEWVEWDSPFLDVLNVDCPKIFQDETK